MGLTVTITLSFLVPSVEIKGKSEFSRPCRIAHYFYKCLEDGDWSSKVKLVELNHLSVDLIFRKF